MTEGRQNLGAWVVTMLAPVLALVLSFGAGGAELVSSRAFDLVQSTILDSEGARNHGARSVVRRESMPSPRPGLEIAGPGGIVRSRRVESSEPENMKTDSTPMEAPKDPEATPILPLLRLFASPQEVAEVEQSFREGGKGYGHYKVRLLELFHEKFDPARKRRQELERDPACVERVLREGALRARALAEPVIRSVRSAAGFPNPS